MVTFYSERMILVLVVVLSQLVMGSDSSADYYVHNLPGLSEGVSRMKMHSG